MDRWEKLHNIIGAAIFGALGLGALAGVIFAGAVHHLLTVGICGAMTAAIIAELRAAKRKADAEARERNTLNPLK